MSLPDATVPPKRAQGPGTEPRRRGRAQSGSSGVAAGTAARRAPAAGRRSVAPVLVRQVRNGIVESEHRGHIVEVDLDGRMVRLIGDPDRIVMLRSTVKPFGVVALIEAGGIDTFELTPAEIAIMASSHSGEDLHVRTVQSMFRRAGVSQTVLACGAEKMPLDALTAARLARDGEKAGPVRHMCSGQHAVSILLSRIRGWPIEDYWHDEHPSQLAYRAVVARAFGTRRDALRTAIDSCGLLTYAFPLREVAKAYAMLAAPTSLADGDPRRDVVDALQIVRDAMVAHPEMIGGSRDRIDTAVMKALPGRLVSKAGMEALRGIAILPGPRSTGGEGPTGIALKIEDGDGYDRAIWAATIEALRQAGLAEGAALRALGRYHRPPSLDAHGRVAAEAIPEFDLAPVGELIG